MLTIWGRPNSLNTQKVLWAAVELGLDFKQVRAGRQFGVNDTAEYLAMNPNGLVPTINDDGFILWESNVIVRYFARRYGAGTSFCPSDQQDWASADRWMDWQASALYPTLNPAFVALIRTAPEKRDAAKIAAACTATEGLLDILDRQLAGRDFVNGRDFTMADIPVGATVNRWYGLPVARQSHPNVERWLNALRSRPGFTAHVDLPLS